MNKLRRTETRWAWMFLGPSLAGISAFLVLPILVVVWLSLTRWDLLLPMRFVGLDNWVDVLTEPALGHSLAVTVAFVVAVCAAPFARAAGGGAGPDERRYGRDAPGDAPTHDPSGSRRSAKLRSPCTASSASTACGSPASISSSR